jgi:hypothetical protein
LADRKTQLKKVSKSMVWFLAVLVAVGVPGAFYAATRGRVPTPLAVLFVGIVGGFVGLQRRLKSLPDEDLALLAESWAAIALSPIAGAVLAELVYLLFISGLLQGNMFPNFVPDKSDGNAPGLKELFDVHCLTYADYAKVLFWSFVAGFSEKFVTNIISRFESREPELEKAKGQGSAQAGAPAVAGSAGGEIPSHADNGDTQP